MPIGIAGRRSSGTTGMLDAGLDCALCNPFHRVMVALAEHRIDLDLGLPIHDALQGLMLTPAHVETVAQGRTPAKGRTQAHPSQETLPRLQPILPRPVA